MRPHFGKMLWRWRPRFGLRALFLVLTMTCVWLGLEVKRWHGDIKGLRLVAKQTAFVATIERFDGSLDLIADTDDLPIFATVTGFLSVAPQTRLDDALETLDQVRVVTFDGGPPDSADYRYMAQLQNRFPNTSIGFIAHFSGGSLYLREPLQQHEAACAEYEAAIARARQFAVRSDLNQ